MAYGFNLYLIHICKWLLLFVEVNLILTKQKVRLTVYTQQV